MSKSNLIAASLESWAKEIGDQVSLNEDETLSLLMENRGKVTFSVDEAQRMAQSLIEASRLINLLSLDSLQLDVHSDHLALMRSQFDKLHAHFHQIIGMIPKTEENKPIIEKMDLEIDSFVNMLG